MWSPQQRRAVFLTAAAAFALTCQQNSPPPLTELPPYRPEYGDGFSAERAWKDLEALTAIGPRVTGTEGSVRARAYIQEQLALAGLEVETKEFSIDRGEGAEQLTVTNLWATVPGASEDLFVLAAPYDTRPFESFGFLGANDGGSGAALLLELARNVVKQPLHYTTRIVFLDGEAPRPDPRSEGAELRLLGSADMAADFANQGLVPKTRLLVVFNQVADADLRIARDLYSHRTYREEFWASAARLDHSEALPPDRAFESVPGSHHPFRSVGLQRVVAIVDTSFGGDEQPGVYANSEADNLEHLSPDSLRIVGEVTLDALDNVSDRLARIDRFSQSPLSEPADEEPASPPPAAETAAEGRAEDESESASSIAEPPGEAPDETPVVEVPGEAPSEAEPGHL